MDKWILSRLAMAVQDCNTGFKEYNFPQAATALFNFWLYELCDVYLEVIKPVVYGSEEGPKVAARATLYPPPHTHTHTHTHTPLSLLSPLLDYASDTLV